ncbi:MAG: RluA family pseudouridine synthase [Bacteroidales bacterium]|nr:RluA family pseudouridine synthase [Bacteroidales bacterium]
MLPQHFTYPFRYTPHPLVREAADTLVRNLDARDDDIARSLRQGKMLGVLITDKGPVYGFSGLAGGRSVIDGFVPPIFDLTDPKGYFKKIEAEISNMPSGAYKSKASAELQVWIFKQYIVHNALGEGNSILEIFKQRGLTPPGGTGECAAPKMLEFAYRNGLKPLAMGEFWYGASPASEVRERGRFYPSCTGKCGPLLNWMMKGLDVDPNPLDKDYEGPDEPEIIYVDDAIIVANKPSGMLSVPGRTASKSLLEWLQDRFGEVHSCHRLDMDTSGLIVYARNLKAKTELELQFAERKVGKTYRARLAAGCKPFGHAPSGTIALPLSADYYDRPRQMVDRENGKLAVTDYEVIDYLPDGEIDVRFRPHTGRTHQLRVHSAHADGLGRPIKGDRLYGAPDGDRLFLIAESLELTHPETKKKMSWCLTTTTHTNHIINNTKTNNQ